MELPCFPCVDRNALCNIHNIKLFKIKKNKNSMEKKFFQKKGITWIFGVIALIFGFLFLDSGFTGNVIVNNKSPTSIVSIIGLLLVTCSTVLIAYSIKKR
jgi:hypothetical protein